MTKKNILVTGGAGFIGSNIVEELLKRGHFVRILDNFSTGKRENIKEFKNDVELIEGDIRSYHIVKRAVKKIEIILHEAALPSVPRSIIDPITTNEVNVMGTLNLLNASIEADVKRFVLASSSSVYGDTPELPKHEGMNPKPLSPYAVSKLAAEKYCNVFANVYGLETVALRYFNVFGPKQDPNSQYSAVIPKFINLMLKNEKPRIYGDGEQSRDFTYIANVVDCNINASTLNIKPGIHINCACNEQVTLNTLVNQINKQIRKDIIPEYVDIRKGDIKYSFANIEIAKKELCYSPRIYFEEGLKYTIKYYQN